MRTGSKAGLSIGVILLIAIAVVVGMNRRSSPPPRVTETPPPSLDKPSEPPPILVAQPTPPTAPIADASTPPAAAPKAQTKSVTTKPKMLSESELMARLRKAQDTDEYQLSYDLAREGLRRFPNSADAPEMAAMVVKSLARQGKPSEARAEAEVMVNKYAGTQWAREVERHTGAHPTQNQVPPK
jgi:TolA-binding protein